jgi:replicative DNA helicase
VLGKAFEELRAVPGNTLEGPESVADVLGRVLDNMDSPTEAEVYHSGVKALDAIYRGAAPGRLDVFAGRPAQGKSVMAVNFINENCIERGIRTMMFSLEMSAEENIGRLLSRRARVNLHRILDPVTHPLEESDWDRIAPQIPTISAAPLIIVDKPMNLQQMAQRVREEMRNGLKIVIVDYLQLMPDAGKPESRQVAVSRNVDGLKLLAREYGIAVIALAQLNRRSTERIDGVPRMSDLRESGAIEQSADTVVLIHRPDQEEPESPRAGEADLIVAKQRNGPTGIAACVFQGHYARFVDFANWEKPCP